MDKAVRAPLRHQVLLLILTRRILRSKLTSDWSQLFTEDQRGAHSWHHSPSSAASLLIMFVCMDSLALYETVDRELSVEDAIARKVSRAAEGGHPFVRVRDLYP